MNDKFSAYIITDDQKKLLEYFKDLSRSKYSNFKTQLEVSKEVGISRARVNFCINFLIEKGILEKTQVGQKSSYKIKDK